MAEFAKLTEAQRERLEMLAEEASEVVKAVTKILRHGYESINPHKPHDGRNRDQLERELSDVSAIVHRMEALGDIDLGAPDLNAVWKRKAPFTHHQVSETNNG